MGRSNPRVIANTTDKDAKTKDAQPPVTFQDVAGADQAKPSWSSRRLSNF
jgi:ATP-dependent Zn protease